MEGVGLVPETNTNEMLPNDKSLETGGKKATHNLSLSCAVMKTRILHKYVDYG